MGLHDQLQHPSGRATALDLWGLGTAICGNGFGRLVHQPPFYHDLLKCVPPGHGEPLIVFPSFLASDFLTADLRHFLGEIGYKAYGWGRGFNLGPSKEVLDFLPADLKTVFDRHGQQPVTLIGHSVGGFYARALAEAFPKMVRLVITLGTPIDIDPELSAASPPFAFLFRALNRDSGFLHPPYAGYFMQKPTVPVMAIYTSRDGIVNPRACQSASPGIEWVKVDKAGHSTLTLNTEVLRLIAMRLAEKDAGPADIAEHGTIRRSPFWPAASMA